MVYVSKSKEKYILFRRLLSKLHVHAHLDRIATYISKSIPLPLIAYDDVKLCFGFYTLVIIEDIERYHQFVRPRRGWTVVDVGAHVGVYTIEVARIVGKTGTVVAIEPEPDNFEMLKFHVALNKLKNIIPLRLALGSRLGYTKLFRYATPHNVISDILNTQNSSARAVKVPIVTLDYVCQKLALKDVDLMKLDVEGAEVEVIRGMKRIFPQHIVGEWHGVARLHKLKTLLQERGYKVAHNSFAQNLGIFYARHVR